jgi:hypothetical protein
LLADMCFLPWNGLVSSKPPAPADQARTVKA